jgi:hypothetical protein
MPETLEDPPAVTERGTTQERPLDRTSFRLAAFGAVLVVVLFAGYGLGRLNNGTTAAPAKAGAPAAGSAMPGMPGMPGMAVDESKPHAHNADGTSIQGGPPAGSAGATGAAAGGYSLSSAGLTIQPNSTDWKAGQSKPLRFRITGAGGAPITTYAIVHDKPLHLIIVRRDLSGFQHLHPTMAPDGTWSVDLTLAAPGSYRAIADFTAVVGGQQVAATLGVDLTVAGNYVPVALPAPDIRATTAGFTITYEGRPSIASTQPIVISVDGPGGKPAALEPYLGAYGHLVVFRLGDLGYVHVHPEPQLIDGKVKFWLAAPGPGVYRMFFNFQVAGQVHTAAWTAVVS